MSGPVFSPALALVLMAVLVAAPLRVALELGARADASLLPVRSRQRLAWWCLRARVTYAVCATAALLALALQIHHTLS